MLQFKSVLTRCPFCDGESYQSHHSVDFPQGRVSWVQCLHDELIYQNPRLTDHSIHDLFNSSDYIEGGRSNKPLGYYSYFEGEEARLAMAKRRIQKIENVLGKGPLDILEIGCASGSLLKVGRDLGHHVQGIDASAVFAKYGRQNYNLDIQVGLFENASFSKSSFDVVFILGSLVCLSSPVKVFTQIRSILKPGGLVVFNIPSLDGLVARLYGKQLWVYRPSVQVLYTRKTASKLLELTGFSQIQIKRDVQSVSLEKLASTSGFLRFGRILGPMRKSFVTLPLPSVFEFVASNPS